MISKINIQDFGPIPDLNIEKLGKINLLVGGNGTGKTYLLKSLYAAIKTIEIYQRGKEPRSEKEILAEKLYWTFQTEELGNIVKKRAEKLSFCLESSSEEKFNYSFGAKTKKNIVNLENSFKPRSENSIFIPAKEILSLIDVVKEYKEQKREFGFDDTYYDLACALSPTTKGRNYKEFSQAREQITELLAGRLQYDENRKEWFFIDDMKNSHPISLTSEGTKKISIIEVLLGNRFLSKNSIVFIDEIEANLHPNRISKFMEIITVLSKIGIQFFISTHSYFVIKKLYILAHKEKITIPILLFDDDGSFSSSDLAHEMPKNSIIQESINLYEEEIDL